MTAFSATTIATLNSVSPSALWVENGGPNAMNFIAGLQSFSDPVDEASLKRQLGHKGAHNQAPKQVLGVVTLHAICVE